MDTISEQIGEAMAMIGDKARHSSLIARQAVDDANATDNKVKAMAAATDNVGIFFGEDIFLAIASILLIKGFLESAGIIVQPLQLSVWAIPTALAAFAVHGGRLLRMKP